MNRRRFLALSAGGLAAGPFAGEAARAYGGAVSGASPPPAALDAAAYRAERRYAALAQGRIAYIERGTGPALLFLHGFPLNSFQWRGAIDRLQAHRRCIAPDFLGLGYTEVAHGQSCRPDAQVEMLVALLDRLGVDHVDLVASDSGGAVAQLLVVRHPRRVRTLLLTNCDAEIDSPPPALLPVLELARAGRFVDEWLARWHADKALARSPEGLHGLCYVDPAHPTDQAIDTYFAPMLRSQRHEDLVHAYALGLDPNPLAGIEAELKRCTIPTRIVWGIDDTVFSKESPDYLARTFGNSRGVRRLERAKLFWPEEQPEVMAAEARALWRNAQQW